MYLDYSFHLKIVLLAEMLIFERIFATINLALTGTLLIEQIWDWKDLEFPVQVDGMFIYQQLIGIHFHGVLLCDIQRGNFNFIGKVWDVHRHILMQHQLDPGTLLVITDHRTAHKENENSRTISWWWGWLGLKSPHSAAEFSSPSHSKGRGSFLILFWLHFQFAAASGWSFHGERVQGIGINRNLNFRLLRLFRSCKLCFPEYENQRRILTLPALVDA